MELIINNKKNKIKSKKAINLKPPQILLLGFALVIMIGTLLLMQPAMNTSSQRMPFIDALFTATSAVCVTGLVVVDTGTTYTIFGQIVILVLIQIGGLGFMTFASLFAILLGRKITFKERLLLQEALNQVSVEGIVRLIRYIIVFAFSLEIVGALILALRWKNEMGLAKSMYYGIFHAISAFNNAGFDIMGNFTSLTGYTSDPITSITIIVLFFLGGIGFFVLIDLFNHRARFKNLSLHSKLALTTSGVLALIGFAAVLALEYSNPQTIAGLDLGGKVLASFFKSFTARTAGFNTIDTSSLRMSTQFIIILLMFIGASPGSTGGGIKTTTFSALLISVVSTFKNDCHETVFERTLHKGVIRKAITIAFVSMCLVVFSTIVLSVSEESDFLTLLFEATSAFGTVGLSMGITPHLTVVGKVMIIITMYLGRVGPLTLFFALTHRSNQVTGIKYMEEKITIG